MTRAFCCNTILQSGSAETANMMVFDALHDDERSHGLDDRHSSGDDTWVMSPFRSQHTRRPIVSRCRLFLRDRSGRLKPDPGAALQLQNEIWGRAHLKYTSSPFEIPPCTPPLQFVAVRNRPS